MGLCLMLARSGHRGRSPHVSCPQSPPDPEPILELIGALICGRVRMTVGYLLQG